MPPATGRETVLPNLDPGPEYADSVRHFQGIPGIERAPAGRLWALWYSGGDDEGPENYVVLVTSGDDGHTWSPPCMVIDPPDQVRAFDPCLWLDPSDRLWLFWGQSLMAQDAWCGVWAITTDDPDSATPQWTAPRRLCDGIMMNKPTALSGDEWLLPASVWRVVSMELPGPRIDPPHMRGANVIVTRDAGATFSFLGQAQVADPLYDEHMIVRRRDDSLWMLIRTASGIAESTSTDGGRTWTFAQPSTLEHTSSRFCIRRLISGALLLVKHSPPGDQQRSHLTAYLSDDDGRTWQGGLLIDDRLGISYPDVTQAPDGSVYLIYDYNRYTDRQILMAVFTEDDILAGAFASPVARSRVLINQATGPMPPR